MSDTEFKPRIVVLLVEDDEHVRKMGHAILAKAGYIVLTAGDAVAALRVSRQHYGRIDVLFTDIELPSKDGIMLAKQITAERPEIGVLLTSGNHNYKHRTEFVLLPKPFLPKDLLNGIAAALKRTEAGRNHHHN